MEEAYRPQDTSPLEGIFEDSICNQTSPLESRYGEGLSLSTILCHHAIRPEKTVHNFTIKTKVDKDVPHHLSYVCLRGKENLQDWSLTLSQDGSLNGEFSAEVKVFTLIISIILLLFSPLFILAIFLWGEEMSGLQNAQNSVNAIELKARKILSQQQDFGGRSKSLLKRCLASLEQCSSVAKQCSSNDHEHPPALHGCKLE